MTSTIVLSDESLDRAKIAVRENKSIKEIASIFAQDVVLPAPAEEFPAVPAPLTITPEFVDALKQLPSVFGAVMPAERRSLSETEIAALYTERETLRVVLDLIKNRDASISETVRHHIDVNAEENGIAVPKPVLGPNGEVIVEATPRDNAGHYILSAPQNPHRVPISGTNQEWSSEYREGAVSIDTNTLEDLVEQGVVSREDYLSMTREVRIFDEAKALKALAAKPERLGIIKSITKRSGATTSLFVRKAKKA